jgi:hypothetical protein
MVVLRDFSFALQVRFNLLLGGERTLALLLL